MIDQTDKAGLNLCDVRMLYDKNRSSTPTKEKVCTSDNLDCWDGACHEASSISCPPVPKFNNMFNSEGQVVDKSVYFSANDQGAWVHTEDESLSPSKQPPSIHCSDSDLERDLDYSYGGHWAMRQETPPSLPLTPSPYLNFSISVFDQTKSQVLSNSIFENSKSPKVRGCKRTVISLKLKQCSG